MIMAKYKYISTISEDDFLRYVVIPCVDEENYVCILVKNSQEKIISSTYMTDNLEIKTNRVLNREKTDYYFHIIKCKKTDELSIQQFDVIYNYVFGKIENPISDMQLATLITSIEEYFRLTADKDKTRIQIGVFGELFTILYLCENGYPEIVNKFHSDFYSKHDVEISSKTRLEIKATDTEKRIHHFKHNQIMRTDVNVFVSSVMLEKSQKGLSLFELFMKIQPLFSSPDSIFALQKLMKKCGVSAIDKGMSFAFKYAYENIKFFDVRDLPKIEIRSVDGVTNIEYDVDCSTAHSLTINELINILR